MRKFILSLLTIFVSSISFAQEIDVIISGKPGGTFYKRSTMYAEILETKGYTVNVIDARSPVRGAEFLKNTDKPTIMIYGTGLSRNTKLDHTPNNFISAEYINPYFLCYRNGAESKKQVTLGVTRNTPSSFFVNYLGKDKTSVTTLPYENTGKLLKGMLGGDIDYMLNNQSRAKKFLASGEGSCVFNTSPNTVFGIPSLASISNESALVRFSTVVGKNINISQIRAVIKEANKDKKFVEFLTSNDYSMPEMSWEQELDAILDNEKQWAFD